MRDRRRHAVPGDGRCTRRVRRDRDGRWSAGCGSLGAWNPRDFATDNYRTVDDRPYGGGPGMVMLAEPLAQAIGGARRRSGGAGVARRARLHLTPAGAPLTHARVVELAARADAGYVLARGALRRASTSALVDARGRRGDRDRRFRRVGRRVAGADADRRDRAAVAGRAERRASRRRRNRSSTGCSIARITRGRRCTRARRCRRCCCRATTRRSGAGGSSSRCGTDVAAAAGLAGRPARCRRKSGSCWRAESSQLSRRSRPTRRTTSNNEARASGSALRCANGSDPDDSERRTKHEHHRNAGAAKKSRASARRSPTSRRATR